MSRIPNTEGDQVATTEGRSMLLQWFPQWWGWYRTNPSQISDENTNTPDAQSLSTTPKDQLQLEDEILNTLAQNTIDSNSLLKRDSVFGKFNFTLQKGSLDICTGASGAASKLMLQLQFQNLVLDIESRPRSGSHFVGLSLGSVLLKDFITNNSEFPDLIKPQNKDESTAMHNRRSRSGTFNSVSSTNNGSTAMCDPLFQLHYEQKPLSYNSDYRLLIKSQSLDIVYNVEPIKWIIDFVMKPHQMINAKKKFEAMKNKTKMELIKNWENILEGDLTERKTWTLEIDISVPQIIFVENFTLKNGTVVVIDFGRLQLTNYSTSKDDRSETKDLESLHKDQSEDEDAFMTPCSTPPGSHASTNESPTLCSALSEIMDLNHSSVHTTIDSDTNTLNERSLHDKLYDRYKMDLTDMQILVCKTNERWLFASAKGSSNLHVLDRFSISLQVERRSVYTVDPQYPSLSISGTLPKLIAHVNEQKIAAITKMLNIISTSNIQSPHRTPDENFEDIAMMEEKEVQEENVQEDTVKTESELHPALDLEASKLFILQFSIDQMSLEVQSRGRCIAELQVTGVKAGFSKRPEDINLSLSVHGLLLVDAIQSFGPDFELLIASHRHVG